MTKTEMLKEIETLHATLKDESQTLSSADRVSIFLYDLAGNKIRTLVDETQNKGEHSFQADLSLLPKGLYLVRMQAGNLSVIKKLVIM